ncbi:MAG: cell wall hydrolase [Lachnospiraceae bacterium]|nr:cell wall hydrolase [Lachnospiraceae bacterium]
MKRLNIVLLIVALVAASIYVGMTGTILARAAGEGNDASIKARLGSLAQSEEGRELLPQLDKSCGNVIDTDAVFEEEYNKTTYKDNGFTKKDLKYLSAIIYCEANSQTFESKVAVANSILNRMYNNEVNQFDHVNTIYEVIYDNKWGVQFSPTVIKSGTSSMNSALELYSSMDENVYKDWQIRCMNESIVAAKAALAGYKTIPDNFVNFNSHLDYQPQKCRDKGLEYVILDKHIYFANKKYVGVNE